MTKIAFVLSICLLSFARFTCINAMKRGVDDISNKGPDEILKADTTDESEEIEMYFTFHGIPDEIMDHILEYASPSILWNIRYTSKYFDRKVSSNYLKNLYTDEGIKYYVFEKSNFKSSGELGLVHHACKITDNFESRFGFKINRLAGCEDIDLILKYLDLFPSYNNSKFGSKKRLSFFPQDSKAFLDINSYDGPGFEEFPILDITGRSTLATFYVGEEDPFTIFPLHQIIPAMFTGNQAFGPYFLANYILPCWRNGRTALSPQKTAFLKKYGKYISPGLQSCFHFVRHVKAIIDNTCSTRGRGSISYVNNIGWTRDNGKNVDINGFILKTFLRSVLFLDFHLMTAVFPAFSTYKKLLDHVPSKMALRIANMWKLNKGAIARAYYKHFGSHASPLESGIDCFSHCFLLDNDVIPEENIDTLTIISIMNPDQWCTDSVPEVWTTLHGNKRVFYKRPAEQEDLRIEEVANDSPQPESVPVPIQRETFPMHQNDSPELIDASSIDGVAHLRSNNMDAIQLMNQADTNLTNGQQKIGNLIYQNNPPAQQYSPGALTIVLEGEDFDEFIKSL